MKKHLFVILMASLVLTACQDDKTPAAQVPTEPAAASATHPASAPEPAETQKMAAVASGNAVAVTKPAKSNLGQGMQAALHPTSTEVKANIEAMIATPPVAEKQAVAKQAAVKQRAIKQLEAIQAKAKQPVAKAPAVHAKEITKTVAKAVPVPQPTIATNIAPKPASKATPKPVVTSPPVIPAVQAAMSGDAAKGKSLARKCKTCHNFTAKKKVGPGLKGVFGRKAGIMAGTKYSPALAAGDWVWNEKNLAIWICDSKKAVKTLSGNASAKTRMGAQRLCDATKQADLIAYLKTL